MGSGAFELVAAEVKCLGSLIRLVYFIYIFGA